MLSVIAMPIITRLVPSSAPAWESRGIRRRNGGDGMICSQNSTPAPNMVPCISQMCTAWFSSARSKGPGRCHTIIAALNRPTETQGRSSRPPSPRSGRDQAPASTPRVTLCPDRPGSAQSRASSSGCHGAPATISDGAANISSRCWIMCAKK